MNAFQTIMEISKTTCPNKCLFCDNVEQVYYDARMSDAGKAKVASLVWRHINGTLTIGKAIMEGVRLNNRLPA